jgi:aminoglycoside phosphotransferase (APT) family kinase protein
VVQSDTGLSIPQSVAKVVLREHGANFDRVQRGRGWSNATWLSDQFVVRVATRPGAADLLRERQLVALLPPEVGCPPIVDAGVRQGHEWVLSRRVGGENLEEVWPSLDDTARAGAMNQMWERARHVHRVDVDAAGPYARSRSPFFPQSSVEATGALDALVHAAALTAAEANGLGQVLERFWAVVSNAPKALNHGDLCTPNALWDAGEVVALLDFEFAVVAPIAIDLNEIIKMAFGPMASAKRSATQRAAGRIIASALDAAGGPDVLIGYAVMLEMWVLAHELEADDPDETDRDNAIAMLKAFAGGIGGYYAPLLIDFRNRGN